MARPNKNKPGSNVNSAASGDPLRALNSTNLPRTERGWRRYEKRHGAADTKKMREAA